MHFYYHLKMLVITYEDYNEAVNVCGYPQVHHKNFLLQRIQNLKAYSPSMFEYMKLFLQNA